ncbi:hypothetical protein ACERII_00900 [Evansella sp. AB-rgal1]|uniref:hypothetical protein n=1 Tax=Evansella sp. AB-rgal1 TaxID=3242696 RepID=UPI00359D7285
MQNNIQQSLAPKSSDQFILPFSFIITSFFALVIFSVSLVISPDAFLPAKVRQGPGLSLAHLFILGWASMLAMGAIYQLIAVVTQQAIYSQKLGFLHFGFYSIGVIGLYISLGNFYLPGMITFGLCTVIGVSLFLFNVLATIHSCKIKNSVISATFSSLSYLGLTVVSGLLMVLNFRFSFMGELHSTLLILHLWFGLLGWFLFLIIGYSFKMLPMFYLSHGYSEKYQKWILLFLHLAIWISILGFSVKYSILFPLSIGFVCGALWLFVLQIQEIKKKRFKKNPGKGIAFFVFLVYFTASVCSVAFLISLINAPFVFSQLLSSLLFFYMFGFVSLSILAYLSKIIPFLWWTFRYGNQVGREETPSLATMIDEAVIQRKLWLIFFSLLLFIGGFFIGTPNVSFATSILFSFSIIFYLVSIIKAFTV